jgi:hypothetical protein
MSIKTTIADGQGTNGEAAVKTKRGIASGLVVYTEPLRDTIAQTKAAVNDTYGADMNQNVSFGGTPEGVHNGTDSALWTASAISGTWTFNSTAQAQAGTKSVDATATVNNDEALFSDATSINTGNYTALTGYIYITGWPTSGTKDVEVRMRNNGTDEGNALNLSNYVNNTTFNTWQKFTIPMTDLTGGSVTVDELVVRTIDIGGGAPPDYYLDTIQFEETGSALTYTVEPDNNSIYRIDTLQITMADAYVSTLTDATHQKLPYNTLLGVAKLTTGINIKLTTDRTIRFNSNFQQHIDFMAFPGTQVQSGGDGTNTWKTYTVPFPERIVMSSETQDKLEITINDDLSGLLYLRMLVRGGKEELT